MKWFPNIYTLSLGYHLQVLIILGVINRAWDVATETTWYCRHRYQPGSQVCYKPCFYLILVETEWPRGHLI